MVPQATSWTRRAVWAAAALSSAAGFVLAGSSVADALGGGRSGAARVQVVSPPAPARAQSTASSPAASAPTPAATERVGVSVLGGPITVSPTSAEVTLTLDDDGVFRGTLPAITVTDARGSLAGWSVRIATTRAFDRSVHRSFAGVVALRAVGVSVVDGDPVGLRTRNAPKLHAAGAVLVDAKSGHGGGSYRIEGTVEVKAHPHNRATTVVVPVLVTLG
jgi:hypothetical protein